MNPTYIPPKRILKRRSGWLPDETGKLGRVDKRLAEDSAYIELNHGELYVELPRYAAQCPMCGNRIVAKGGFTCGDPYCGAGILYYPYLRNFQAQAVARRERKKKNGELPACVFGRRRSTDKSRVEKERKLAESVTSFEVYAHRLVRFKSEYAWLHTDESLWWVDNEFVGEDRRGIFKDSRRKNSPWAKGSEAAVLYRAVGGRPALTIAYIPGLSIAECFESHFKISGFTHAFDYLLAWKCTCENHHEVQYKTVADLPNDIGYHEPCPWCGEAPIEIAGEF